MNPFHTFDQDTLLEALTQYYSKYRFIMEKDWNEREFAAIKDTLFSILDELNERTGYDFDRRELSKTFTFDRKAD